MSRMIDDEETLSDYGLNEKQTIIDGCNVAECVYLKNNRECQITTHLICEYSKQCKVYDNCYFKQLQRAKAEITHWSSLANEANERATEYGNECIKLEAENERLKKELDDLKRIL